MKKKIVWLVVSCWMVAILLMTSCAPAVVEEKEEKVAPPVKEGEVVPKEVVVPEKEANMVKWTGKKQDGTVVEKMLEKPRYGGVHTAAQESQPAFFDEFPTGKFRVTPIHPTNEPLMTRDWTKGPGGTGEWTAQASVYPPVALMRGLLAESWEVLDDSTAVFHIRQGVHFALDPTSEASRLVGGREVTADDVIFSAIRQYQPGGYNRARAPYLMDMQNIENSIYVSPTDEWAVVMKTEPGLLGVVFETVGEYFLVVAPELFAKYKDLNDWKNTVGTGPFTLKEYVGASSLTYLRNPIYWQHDPFFPENQLPYLDVFKVLIIPDLSTRQAALRTGRIDNLHGADINADAAEPLLKSNPELEWVVDVGATTTSSKIHMRVDKPELPWYDVRVRQALALAIDKQELLNEFYDGKATLYNFNVPPLPEFKDIFIPYEELPESIRELYEYHPDKAKQLLAEAGYPQGFKAEVLCSATWVDLLSLIKEYWAAIGVDLKIDVRDAVIVTTMSARKTHTQMYAGGGTSVSNPYQMNHVKTGGGTNASIVSDPKIDEAARLMNEAYFDTAKRNQIMRDIDLYVKEQVYIINLPSPWPYFLWHPWLKGYYGTVNLGITNGLDYCGYVWIDQELKKAMGR